MYLFYKILVLQNYRGYTNFDVLSFEEVSKYNKDFLVYYEIYKYKYCTDNTENNINLITDNIICDLSFRISSISSNNFLSNEKKNTLYSIFSNAKNVYNKFSRLAYLFKLKKAKHSTFDTDLTLFPLDELTDKCKLTIYDEASRIIYNFRISDIINIINNNLSEAPYFFVEPIPIKNPQTNIIFTYAALCNIYFKLRESSYVMPLLFKLFFLSDFNLEIFTRKYESIIRDHAIVKFSKNMTSESKVEYIKLMIYDFDTIRKPLRIHDDFPSEKLIEVFGEMLTDFLFLKYSLNSKVKENSDSKIFVFFSHFKKCNPNFGRKFTAKNISQVLPCNRKLYKIHKSHENDSVFYFVDNVFKNIIEFSNYNNDMRADMARVNNLTLSHRKSIIGNRNKWKKTKQTKQTINKFHFITQPLNLDDGFTNINVNNVVMNESNENIVISELTREHEQIVNDYVIDYITKTINYVVDYIEMCNMMESLIL
jgi:hypothetical protein